MTTRIFLRDQTNIINWLKVKGLFSQSIFSSLKYKNGILAAFVQICTPMLSSYLILASCLISLGMSYAKEWMVFFFIELG